MVSPIVLAALRLMISSTLVACWTGSLAGFSLLRIRHSIGAEDPIQEKVNHGKISIRVPVMNEVQFLFASEPCKSLKARFLDVVFLV